MTSIKVLPVEAGVEATFNFQPYGSKVTIETKIWLVKIACKARMKSGMVDIFAV